MIIVYKSIKIIVVQHIQKSSPSIREGLDNKITYITIYFFTIDLNTGSFTLSGYLARIFLFHSFSR